jgi:hypothetical protein
MAVAASMQPSGSSSSANARLPSTSCDATATWKMMKMMKIRKTRKTRKKMMRIRAEGEGGGVGRVVAVEGAHHAS